MKVLEDAKGTFALAESARDQGRLEDAARLFGRSATRWAKSGKAFPAIDAYFELGAILILQGRVGLIPDLAEHLLDLLRSDSLPPGSSIKIAVFALLMRKGAADPGPFFSLVHQLRRHRAERRRQEEEPPRPVSQWAMKELTVG